MKATHSGYMIGKALEDQLKNKETVMVFVNIGFADPGNTLSGINLDENGNIEIDRLSSDSINLPENLIIGGVESNGSLTNVITSLNDNLSTLSDDLANINERLDSTEEKIAGVESGIVESNIQIASTAAGLELISGKFDSLLENINPLLISNDLMISTKSGALTIQPTLLESLNNRFADLDSRIATLAAELNTTNDFSVDTAQMASIVATSGAQLNLDDVALNSAIISGTLNVTGRTILNDLGVTGRITTGALSIIGLNENGNASINSLDDLYIQDKGLGGINILSGKITIDETGYVRIQNSLDAKTVNTQKLNIVTTDNESSNSAVLSASAGIATMKEGTNAITINTTAVNDGSLIYVTFNDDYSPAIRYWTNDIADGESFKVNLNRPVAKDAQFNWWIVN